MVEKLLSKVYSMRISTPRAAILSALVCGLVIRDDGNSVLLKKVFGRGSNVMTIVG